MFVFVKGTDPDAILLIESRASVSGQHEWQYALVRFNSNCSLKAKFEGAVVWRVAKISGRQITDPTEPYFTKRGELESPIGQ